jgi:hypothetical protein
LKAHDLKLEEMPMVMQFNKRDLKDICTLEEMNDVLNKMNGPFYEAVAKDGIGVEETLQAISGLVLKSVIDRYGGDRSMAPMGRVASDPARTDPDALVSAAAESTVASARRSGAAGAGAGSDVSARATTWPSAAEVSKVPSDDSNPLDAFENLNIEGILDEALKLDEAEEPPRPAPATHRRQTDTSPGSRDSGDDDNLFSGLLDEALGSQETESILDSVLGAPEAPPKARRSAPSDPMREIQDELLGGDALESSYGSQRPDLSELIKTRVSIPADKVTTNAPGKVSKKTRAPIEVPVEVEVEADALSQDIELILKIRLKPKR